jgi:hypothetical protein
MLSMDKKRLTRYMHFFSDDGEPFDGDGYNWKWFGTLTFPDEPKRSVGELWPGHRAFNRYYRWFDEVQAKEGPGSRNFLNWVRITECSSSDIRFYVLFGGERIGNKRKWLTRWNALGGSASIFSYRPGKFCHYVLKHGKMLSSFEIDMALGDCLWIFADYGPGRPLVS